MINIYTVVVIDDLIDNYLWKTVGNKNTTDIKICLLKKNLYPSGRMAIVTYDDNPKDSIDKALNELLSKLSLTKLYIASTGAK